MLNKTLPIIVNWFKLSTLISKLLDPDAAPRCEAEFRGQIESGSIRYTASPTSPPPHQIKNCMVREGGGGKKQKVDWCRAAKYKRG